MRRIRAWAVALLAAVAVAAACSADAEQDERATRTGVDGQTTSATTERDEGADDERTDAAADTSEDEDAVGSLRVDDPEPGNDEGSGRQQPASDEGVASAPDDEARDEEASASGYVVSSPDDVDGEYLDRVMYHLLRRESDVLRGILAREPGEPLGDDEQAELAAVHDGPRLREVLDNFETYAIDAASRQGFLPSEDMEALSWETERIVERRDSCVVAIGRYDFSGRTVSSPSQGIYFVTALAPDEDRSGSNPTPWVIHDSTPLVSGGEPIRLDQLDDVDYTTALEDTCP